jgi:hypothetical protein
MTVLLAVQNKLTSTFVRVAFKYNLTRAVRIKIYVAVRSANNIISVYIKVAT